MAFMVLGPKWRRVKGEKPGFLQWNYVELNYTVNARLPAEIVPVTSHNLH